MKAYTATCTRRILVAVVMGLSLVLTGSVRSTAESENLEVNQTINDRSPTGTLIVKSGRFCPSPNSLLPTYGAVDDAVRDTIPNEWENGYSNPYGQYITTNYPALKSAAIIFRTAIRHFETYSDPDPDSGSNYRTYNVDVRAGQPAPPGCVGRMNTVYNSSGRYGGSPSFNSNQATTDTANQYIVCAALSFGDRCLVETSPPIEASTVFCNEQSNGSDVGFCALQALYYGIVDTFVNGAGNKHVRRLNVQSATSLTFEVESFDRRFDNVPPVRHVGVDVVLAQGPGHRDAVVAVAHGVGVADLDQVYRWRSMVRACCSGTLTRSTFPGKISVYDRMRCRT